MPAAISLSFAAMMQSFSCKPLIFFVCSMMVAKPARLTNEVQHGYDPELRWESHIINSILMIG